MDAPLRELLAHRREHAFPVGLRSDARRLAEATLAILFPHFATSLLCDEATMDREVTGLTRRLRPFADAEAAQAFVASLPKIERTLMEDAQAAFHCDPAAASVDEVILAYPGFYALAIHRAAHRLHALGVPLLPRLLAEHAHERTGIDIHPGATLGRGMFIDHGTGVVIGETAVVGNRARIYQGVTLGALAVRNDLARRKRHPTLQDDVVVYANATILGGETVIGHDTVVGASAWVTSSVPPFSNVGRDSEVRPRRDGGDSGLEFYL